VSDLAGLVTWASQQGLLAPAAIARGEARRWLVELEERRYAAATVRRKVAAARSYFRWLQRHGEVSVNPFATTRPRRGTQRLPRVPDVDDLVRQLDALARQHPRDLLVRALVEVLYASGVRVSELCRLDLADLEPERAAMRVWGKWATQRWTLLSPPACEALGAYLEIARPARVREQSPPAVFLDRSGQRLGPRAVRHRLDALDPRRSGIPRTS
jgi:integrase/recombinase XerC